MARSKNKSYKRVIGLSRRCNLKANSQYDERKGIQGLVLGALYQRFVQTNLCASPAEGGRRNHFVASPASILLDRVVTSTIYKPDATGSCRFTCASIQLDRQASSLTGVVTSTIYKPDATGSCRFTCASIQLDLQASCLTGL